MGYAKTRLRWSRSLSGALKFDGGSNDNEIQVLPEKILRDASLSQIDTNLTFWVRYFRFAAEGVRYAFRCSEPGLGASDPGLGAKLRKVNH
jgi:hypothetical protein